MTREAALRSSSVLLWLAAGFVAQAAACARCESETESGVGGPDIDSPFDPERSPDRLGPPPDRMPVGSWAATDDYRMRVLRVEPCDVEPYFAPREGFEKIGAFVEIEGRTGKEVPANVLHATLTDASGETYAPTPAGCRPTLAAGRVTSGSSARGFVSFEVPRESSGLILHYEPVILGRSGESLHFDLTR